MAESRINKLLAVTVFFLAAIIVYVTWRALDYRANVNVFLEKYTNVVNEFSERAYYAAANDSLRADTLIPNRVVFFGTQVTDNWNLEKSFPDYQAINRGVPGQRLAGMLLRFQPDVIALGPEVVLIEISSYNFREESSIAELFDYARAMAELAKYNGIEPILTTLIPHREGYQVYESDYNVIDSIAIYGDMVKEYCAEQRIAWVDFNRLLANDGGYLREDLLENAVQPNDRGYSLMAGEVNKTIDSLLQAMPAAGSR